MIQRYFKHRISHPGCFTLHSNNLGRDGWKHLQTEIDHYKLLFWNPQVWQMVAQVVGQETWLASWCHLGLETWVVCFLYICLAFCSPINIFFWSMFRCRWECSIHVCYQHELVGGKIIPFWNEWYLLSLWRTMTCIMGFSSLPWFISLSLAVTSPPDGGGLGYVMCRGARLHECSSEKMAN